MSTTYTQLYVHIVFAVKGRQNLILPRYRDELHAYITGLVQHRGAKMLAVFAMPDHVHLLIGFSPTHTLADLVRDVKAATSGLMKEKGWCPGFAWQEGYGAFTYAQSQVQTVVKYILNQEEHHRRRTFREEYPAFLEKFEVPFKPEYVFDFYDNQNEG